jgi:hypothetical protein
MFDQRGVRVPSLVKSGVEYLYPSPALPRLFALDGWEVSLQKRAVLEEYLLN